MKNLIYFISFLFFTVSITVSAQEQTEEDPIKSYPGIPLMSYLYGLSNYFSPVYDKIDTLGFHTVIINDIHQSPYNQYDLGGYAFKIMPNQEAEIIGGQSGRNLILRYTEAKYSVWQAEGTPPVDGEATLVMNDTFTVKDNSNSFLMTKNQYIPKGTELISGPQYWQDACYLQVGHGDTVEYTADFCLKLEEYDPEMSAADTVCNLQVTASIIKYISGFGWDTTDYRIIAESPVLYGDFTTLNQWQHFLFNYKLSGLPGHFYNQFDKPINQEPVQWETTSSQWINGTRNHVRNVEFKIIWKGNAEVVRLSVDSVTISDERGRRLTDPDLFPTTKGLIENMLDANYITTNYDTKLTGWMGLDEPGSIDNFEPIRIVQNIIDQYGQGKGLWLATGSGYNGRWGVNVPVGEINPFGTYSLKTFEEFYKRVGKANLWSDYYLYIFPDPTYGSDYRDAKIKYMVDTMWSQFKNKENVYWGVSVQTGKYHNPEVSWIGLREIDSKDLLYNVNIALLAGARLISLWTYFSNHDYGTPVTHTALVNVEWPTSDHTTPPSSYEYTAKWYTLKDTIAPRLKGLMGKTLKKLKTVNHKLGIDALVDPQEAIPPYDYIDYIHAYGGPGDTCLVELGIFEDLQDIYEL